MKRVGLLGLLLGSAFGFVLLLSACQGAAGPQGPAGQPGPQGPPGAQGAAAVVAGDGLVMKITKVDVGADNRPVVSFTLADAKNNPLDIAALDANSARFTMAKVSTDGSQYVNYIIATVKGADYKLDGLTKKAVLSDAAQAGMDAGGDFTSVKVGQYTYKFKTVLGGDYDKAATNVVGGQATRNARKYVDNDVFYFIPAGGTPSVMRQVVAVQSCNQCHDPLAAHGGSRVEPRLCVLCHTPQTSDPETGSTVEFKVMIHKIHDGRNLPSVLANTPYYIVGFGQNPIDFSDIGFPQNIRNCTTCHGAPPAGMTPEDYAKAAPQASNWTTNPTRAACGACHDQIDWTTGKSRIAGGRDHAGGPQIDDKQCKTCHQPSGAEFDASVVGAHAIPERSTTLKGITFSIAAATAKAGEKPTVDFSIKDGAGTALDPNKVDSVSITLAYPTTDYANRITETVNTIPAAGAAPFVRAGTLTDLGSGVWRYTFAKPLDAAAKGTAGVGLQVYRNATVKANLGKDVVVRESNVNPVSYASIDGSPVTPRRTVVKRDNCNTCHLDLGSPAGISVHGGTRRNPEFCIMCHNPNTTDEAFRPKDMLPPESIQFKYMIHSLHQGEERVTPTAFYGRGIADTEEIIFPTARGQRDCAKCHVGSTNVLPLPPDVLPMTITQAGQVVKVVPPIQATCIACHIGKPGFNAHVDTMTSAKFGEACNNCHAVGKDFDVAKVHTP